MHRISVPYKTRDDLRHAAEHFLRKYHPDGSYPVPIEEIIEFKLGLDIVPLPDLHRAFDVDGFLAAGRMSISVDEGVYQSRPGRYRFTLAHEVGHFVLHKSLYDEHKFRTIDEWKEFIARFPDKEYSWFEWQAYEFAGHILVPGHHLEKRFRYHKKRLRSLGFCDETVIVYTLAGLLAKDFVVSREVIQRRLGREKMFS